MAVELNQTIKFKVPYFESFLHHTGTVVGFYGEYVEVKTSQFTTHIHNTYIYE